MDTATKNTISEMADFLYALYSSLVSSGFSSTQALNLTIQAQLGMLSGNKSQASPVMEIINKHFS